MSNTFKPLHFQFQFVNSFLALFYTAFYLQDMDRLKEVDIHDIFNFDFLLLASKKLKTKFLLQLLANKKLKFISVSAFGRFVDHSASGWQPERVPLAICNKTPQGDLLNQYAFILFCN